jgi:uncharacterized protein (TIGR02246 family)
MMDGVDVATEIADGFARAWNRHDMEELGKLFHDDADFVNVVGVKLTGRESIKSHHAIGHAGPFANSTLQVAVDDAREIVPGIIVAHVHSQLEGDGRAPRQTRHTLMTLVIEQRAARWMIVAAHNTNLAVPANQSPADKPI